VIFWRAHSHKRFDGQTNRYRSDFSSQEFQSCYTHFSLRERGSTPLIPRIIVQGLLSQMSLIMHESIPHNPVGFRRYSYFLTCYIDLRNFMCWISSARKYTELSVLYSECSGLKLLIITYVLVVFAVTPDIFLAEKPQIGPLGLSSPTFLILYLSCCWIFYDARY